MGKFVISCDSAYSLLYKKCETYFYRLLKEKQHF